MKQLRLVMFASLPINLDDINYGNSIINPYKQFYVSFLCYNTQKMGGGCKMNLNIKIVTLFN